MIPLVSQQPISLSRNGAGEMTSLSTVGNQVTAKPKDAKEAFKSTFGQVLFGQLVAELRKSQQTPAYFNGGQAEKSLQGQLDQMVVERLADSASDRFTEPMYQQFMTQSRSPAFDEKG